MDESNPYAPPNADLTQASDNATGPRYHPVSQTKFALLYFLTFGLYLLVWFYYHWRLVKEREKTGIWPVPRAIFAIFFVHALFRRIGETAGARGVGMAWRPNVNATWYVVLSIVSNLADRIAELSEAFTPLDFLALACFIAIYLPLRQVQQTINEINDDPQGGLNADYPIGTVLVMILGGLLWLVGLAGAAAILLDVTL